MTKDIKVKLSVDGQPLQQGMNKAGRSVDDFSKKTKQMSINVAKAGAAVVVAVAAIGASVLKMASEAAAAGVEIKNLSAQAGISTTDFQKMAAATRTVGFEQEKLSDILKDVNDKFGDFQATGAGPLADFFENIAPKIGVTANMFAKLSGPDALQLYVSSLEKAGVSQKEMTFYMEALASDATRLIPLLQNNGQEMARLGDEAERTGRILSDETIAGAVELDRELAALANTLKTKATTAIVEYKDEIIEVVDFITNKLIPAMGSTFESAVAFAQDIGVAVQALKVFLKTANQIAGLADLDIQAPGGGEGGSGGEGLNEGNLTAAGRTALGLPPLAPVQPTPPLSLDIFGGGGGGGGGGVGDWTGGKGGSSKRASLGLTDDDFEALEAAFATESEIIANAQAEQLAELQAFRDAGIGAEEEYNDLEKRIKERHNADMAALDRAAMQSKLSAFSGMFGDLSTLMQSENKKLFEIGKAAAIAEAVVSGINSAITAWEKGMSVAGPPGAVAFAAASVAKTGAMIGQLRSAQSSGGGGGAVASGGGQPVIASQGGGGGGGGGGAAAEQAQRASVNLTLIGDQGFTRAQVVQVAEALNEAGGDGTRLIDIRGRR